MDLLASCSTIEDFEALAGRLDGSQIAQIAESCLDIFLGANFAGCGGVSPLPVESVAASRLSFGMNAPSRNAKLLSHLLVCRLLLVDRLKDLEGPERITAFRCLLAWQKTIDEPSVEIKELIEQACSSAESLNLENEEKSRFLLERAEAHLIYYEYEKAEQAVQNALAVCGMNVELAGKLGKRTRFQQNAVSQLVLTAEVNSSVAQENDADVPANVSLNDDTLLESVSFLGEDQPANQLTPIQLAVILALCRIERRTQHNDVLLQEKCAAFLSTIIEARRCWAVQAAALLMRSDLERNHKRRVERACSQAEFIVKLMDGVDDATPVEERPKRCRWLLASGLDPSWKARNVHAEILRSLGCTSEALLIYEQLENWDQVVDCYKSLEQLDKANSLIHKLLETRPNDSMLYVYLGDINQQASYYEKAIEISSDRNARARKALGWMLLMRNQYEQAYVHLRRSLELQPIQLGVWFNAGHCAWQLEKYMESATCFHRCVSLEPDHFEAWNNLSAAYIRQGQKERAKRILQEALKFNYEHPKVWENYLLLCVDTGDFSQAIASFHRLLDLNKKQNDDEVLEILASEVHRKQSEELNEEDRRDLANLKKDLVKLLARVTSAQTLSAKVWNLYALLKRPEDENATEFEKYIQLLERGLLSASNKPDWAKEAENCISTLQSAVLLGQERLELARLKASEDALKQTKSRVRMSLRPLITIAEKQYPGGTPENVYEAIGAAKELLATVV